MGFYIRLAFKNLLRHGRRTLITALAIAFGLGAYLIMDSMLQGADKASEQNLILYETGSVRIYSPQGAKDRDRLSLKSPVQRTADALFALGEAGFAVAPRVSFLAEIFLTDPRYDTPSSQVVRAIAVDPAKDERVFPRGELGLDGRWFAAKEEGVVVGRWLAEDLGLRPGSPLSLSARTQAGSYQVIDLEVTGIVDSPNPVVNRTSVFLPLDLIDGQLEMSGNATEIVVGQPVGSDSRAAAQKVEGLLQKAGLSVTVLNWQDMAPDFMAVSQGKQKGSAVILFLVFLIAAVGISNTLLMAFYERKTEIGMLRALGMDDRTLFWTFLLEAAGIGLVGSLLGLALGAGAVAWMVHIGVDFTPLIRKIDIGYRISGVFHGVWAPASFVAALFWGVALSAATAVFPTRRALRIPITECLRPE